METYAKLVRWKQVLNSEGDSSSSEFLELQMHDLVGVVLMLRKQETYAKLVR